MAWWVLSHLPPPIFGQRDKLTTCHLIPVEMSRFRDEQAVWSLAGVEQTAVAKWPVHSLKSAG